MVESGKYSRKEAANTEAASRAERQPLKESGATIIFNAQCL